MRKTFALLALVVVGMAIFVPAAAADTALNGGTLIDPSSVDTGSDTDPVVGTDGRSPNSYIPGNGYCFTIITPVASFSSSFQATSETQCESTFDVFITERLCLQRGFLGVYTNVTCSRDIGIDALTNGALHFCTSAILNWDWRVRIRGSYTTDAGTRTAVYTTHRITGRCY